MQDLNLKVFNSEVHYAAIPFASAPKPYWLPVTATIDVETARQHWRNIHQFTNYKKFSVESESAYQPDEHNCCPN